MALVAGFNAFLNDPVTGAGEPQAMTTGLAYRLRNSERFRREDSFGSGNCVLDSERMATMSFALFYTEVIR
jgi:hypothetical protein